MSESNLLKNEQDLFIENYRKVFSIAKRLHSLSAKMRHMFPITLASYEKLPDTELELVDALIFRFSKLQNMLGAKIFRGLVVLELDEAGSMLDTINKMEQKHIVDMDEWLALRESRNSIVHDYILESGNVIKTLNLVYERVPILLDLVLKVREHCINKLKLDMSEFMPENFVR